PGPSSFCGSAPSNQAPNSTVTVNDGCWHHLVGSFTPGHDVALYVDGVPQATLPSATYVESSAPFLLGGVAEPTPAGRTTGLIDEVSVCDAALSSAQV